MQGEHGVLTVEVVTLTLPGTIVTRWFDGVVTVMMALLPPPLLAQPADELHTMASSE